MRNSKQAQVNDRRNHDSHSGSANCLQSCLVLSCHVFSCLVSSLSSPFLSFSVFFLCLRVCGVACSRLPSLQARGCRLSRKNWRWISLWHLGLSGNSTKDFDTVTGEILGSRSGLKKEISLAAVVQTSRENTARPSRGGCLTSATWTCSASRKAALGRVRRSMFLCSAVQPGIGQCGASSISAVISQDCRFNDFPGYGFTFA